MWSCLCERRGRGAGAVELAPASAPARPCLAALNLSPIKSPSLAGCNWARRAGSMWLLKMRRLERERGRERGRKQGRWKGGGSLRTKMRCMILWERAIISWGRRAEAEMLIDRELHKANCVCPLRTLEILLSQICQGWFHPGSGGADGLSQRYWATRGRWKGVVGSCVQQQSFANRSLISHVRPTMQARFWHPLTLQTRLPSGNNAVTAF